MFYVAFCWFSLPLLCSLLMLRWIILVSITALCGFLKDWFCQFSIGQLNDVTSSFLQNDVHLKQIIYFTEYSTRKCSLKQKKDESCLTEKCLSNTMLLFFFNEYLHSVPLIESNLYGISRSCNSTGHLVSLK